MKSLSLLLCITFIGPSVVDLSLKSSADQEVIKKEDLDQEDYTDDDIEDDQEELDDDCDNDSIGTSTPCSGATTVLNPLAR